MLRSLTATAALLAAVPPSLALSSHSPRDLESHPSFAVVLSEHHLLNDTLSDILSEPLETPPHSSPPSRHLLRTPNGQSFLCTVPAVTDEAKKRADQQAEEEALIQAEEKERGVAHGVALLEPMRQGCLYQKQGWFTYSFCYGSEIRQFHEIRLPNSPGPSEDPQSDSYTLGVAPEPVASLSPAVRERVETEMVIPSRLGGGEGGGWDEGGRYLSQTWEGGTICDKTGLPRTVEVQYHCNTQSIDHIALIRETSICRYVLLIHTPRLCGEPLFLDGHMRNQEPPATIECQPVVRKVQERLSEAGESEKDGSAAGLRASPAQGEGKVAPPPPPALQPATPPHLDHPSHAYPPSSPEDEQLDRSVDSADFDPPPDDAATLALQDALDNLEGVFTLVYDAETGEVHSAEVGLDDGLLGAQGEKGEEKEEKDGERVGEKVERENEELTKTLEELAKLMHSTLSEALRGGGNAPPPPGPAAAADPAAAVAPQHVLINPALLHQHQQGNAAANEGGNDAVAAFIRAVAENGAGAGAGAAGQGNVAAGGALQKYLQGLQGQGHGQAGGGAGAVGRKVSPVEPVRNEAHERLKAGFERRWDQEDEPEEGKEKGRMRDEL